MMVVFMEVVMVTMNVSVGLIIVVLVIKTGIVVNIIVTIFMMFVFMVKKSVSTVHVLYVHCPYCTIYWS